MICAESCRRNTASHKGAVKRSSMDVRSRNERRSAGWREHLAREVVDDISVIASEFSRCAVPVGRIAERERSQIETGRPTFHPLEERLERVLLNVRARLFEKRVRLRAVEREISRPELEYQAPRPKPSERERQGLARSDHEPAPNR
jgi:hypothetical protein